MKNSKHTYEYDRKKRVQKTIGKMANFDEKIKFEVTKAFRNKLTCQYCEIFPKPGVKMMCCSSCTKLLCQNCRGTACPLCQYKSKNQKFPTFIEQPLLMEVLSGFKTHPCINIKNGCLEEIPAKMDELEAHAQSCIFQMVPCPKMHCRETFIFKDLDKHLKQAHKNDAICIYYGTETNEYTDDNGIFGIYKMQAELINGRNYYQNDQYAIWFGGNVWMIGLTKKVGGTSCYSFIRKDIPFLDCTTNWQWQWGLGTGEWEDAHRGLGVKGNT